jgi:ATP-binding cassette subfamily B protein
MNYGTFTAVITLVGRIQGPITSMSGYIPRWYAMQASAERLMEAESFAEDCARGKRSREEVLDFYNSSFAGLSLKDASFTYKQTGEQDEGRERSVVIRGADLDVDKRDILAITGPSGCGKSTLLKILMSFYPLDSGERLIKTNEGTIPLDSSWRGLFAYVPQGNQLMSGSIREVLTFGDRSVPDADIASALDIACASDFIAELPEGLETMLGERGAGLSEGQIQRLAIARAILSGQPVLLLDEATSSLDEATEAELIQKLRTLTDRTVIIVTHRLKVLSICNKELRMDEVGVKECCYEDDHTQSEGIA